MKPYFVEGQIQINIECEIDADSLEDAKKKVFEMFKKNHALHYYEDSVSENYDLTASEFEGIDYSKDYDDDDYDDDDA
jgi:hypothetical protein